MSEKVVYKSSFPFFSIMFLILMTLKLTNIINWSWWLITAPLWGPFIAVILMIIAIGLFTITVKSFVEK